LTFGETSLDGKFNPIISDSTYDGYVVDLMFDALVDNTPEGEPKADVAERWEISEDGKTYTFYLKKGIRFHDGHELTAEDVQFTYETIAHPDYNGPRWSTMQDVVGAQEFRDGKADHVDGIKIIDEYTISFTTKEINAPKIINDFIYEILPKHYYQFEDFDDFIALNQNPMGSGPFKFVRYVVGQYLEIEANEEYFKGRPKLDGVIVKIVPAETIPAELQAGVIDIGQLTQLPEDVEIATETGIVDIQQFTGNGYTYVGINLRRDNFKDKRGRQALMYGLNRRAFIDSHYEGYAEPCNTAVSPVSWAYTEKVNKYEYDPEKAKELLKEAGWEDRDNDGWVENEKGEKLEIVWTAYNDVAWPQELVAVAKENWKEIGVRLEGELMEFNAVSDKVYDERDFDLFNMGWSLSIDPDPRGIFDKASDSPGGYNSMGFYNEEAEQIMAQGILETDFEKRKAMYQRWAEIANEELPYLFIAYRQQVFGVNNRVKNLKLAPYTDWVWDIEHVEVSK
jgi:peptide/nickel transport system substrate-binding protein